MIPVADETARDCKRYAITAYGAKHMSTFSESETVDDAAPTTPWILVIEPFAKN